MDPISTALFRLVRSNQGGDKPADARSRWKKGIGGMVLAKRLGAAKVLPSTDTEGGEVDSQTKFQKQQSALNNWYDENAVERSFEQANEQLFGSDLMAGHLEAAMDSFESATGETLACPRSLARTIPHWTKTTSMLNLVAMVFALIPPCYENDAFDPLFFGLFGVQVLIVLGLVGIGVYSECAQRFPEASEDSGVECDRGNKTAVLPRDYVVSAKSAAAGKVIGNFNVLRMFMIVRLMSVATAFTLNSITFFNYESGAKSPKWFFPAGLALLTLTLGENIASYNGYGPYCPSYTVAVRFLQVYYGGGSKIPFAPVEKAMFRFASMVLLAFIVPGYIVTIVHKSMGVKSTASFVVPMMCATQGMINLLMISCAKT